MLQRFTRSGLQSSEEAYRFVDAAIPLGDTVKKYAPVRNVARLTPLMPRPRLPLVGSSLPLRPLNHLANCDGARSSAHPRICRSLRKRGMAEKYQSRSLTSTD
jgi:hypothetical protein